MFKSKSKHQRFENEDEDGMELQVIPPHTLVLCLDDGLFSYFYDISKQPRKGSYKPTSVEESQSLISEFEQVRIAFSIDAPAFSSAIKAFLALKNVRLAFIIEGTHLFRNTKELFCRLIAGLLNLGQNPPLYRYDSELGIVDISSSEVIVPNNLIFLDVFNNVFQKDTNPEGFFDFFRNIPENKRVLVRAEVPLFYQTPATDALSECYRHQTIYLPNIEDRFFSPEPSGRVDLLEVLKKYSAQWRDFLSRSATEYPDIEERIVGAKPKPF